MGPRFQKFRVKLPNRAPPAGLVPDHWHGPRPRLAGTGARSPPALVPEFTAHPGQNRGVRAVGVFTEQVHLCISVGLTISPGADVDTY